MCWWWCAVHVSWYAFTIRIEITYRECNDFIKQHCWRHMKIEHEILKIFNEAEKLKRYYYACAADESYVNMVQ